MELINAITAMFGQVANSPACLFIVVGINVLIFAWEAIPGLNSRYIVLVSIVLGAVGYPLFAHRSTVPPEFPYPLAVLIVNGLMSGLLAFALHKGFVLVLRKATGWPPEPEKPPPTE